MKDHIKNLRSISDGLASGEIKSASSLKSAAEALRKISESMVNDDPSTKIDLTSFISELNGDLALEYASMIQYLQHSSVIKSPGFESFIPHLLEHAKEEFEHAKMISEKISYLGGTPVISMAEAFGSDDNQQMLLLDLQSERTAIERYKKRIRQAEELGEYGVKNMLEQILIQEEEHENDIMNILGLERG